MKFAFLLSIILSLLTVNYQDKKIRGTWDNGQGQLLVFKKDSEALWIFYSESKRDTFRIKYATDFSAKPYKLDLSGFSTGPLKGKTLYGIVAFTDKRTLKFDCEPGTTAAVRPKEFNLKQTQVYKKK